MTVDVALDVNVVSNAVVAAISIRQAAAGSQTSGQINDTIHRQ